MKLPAAVLLSILTAVTLTAQTVPAELQAAAATNKQVDLIWKGNPDDTTSYVVERRFLGDAAFSSIATVTTPDKPAYFDKSFDPYATYVYRVRAVRSTNATTTTSEASNEITVGPPPVGVSLVSPTRKLWEFQDTRDFGRRPTGVLDSNGDPAVLYFNSVGDNSGKDSFVEFVSWNRAKYRWNPAVKVETVGDSETTGPGYPMLWLARDASDNTWVVAVQAIPSSRETRREIRLLVSKDNGLTWTKTHTVQDDTNEYTHPSVAVANGTLHFTWSSDSLYYATGKLTDPQSKWTTTEVPLAPGATGHRSVAKIALGANGEPVVLYGDDGDNYYGILAVWRPKTNAVTRLMDTAGLQNDNFEFELAMQGNLARVAARIIRDDLGNATYDHQLWVTTELPDGSFTPPVAPPVDGNTTMGYISFALGSRGQGALVADKIGGNEGGEPKCGLPKLHRSDDLVNWTVCSPYGSNEPPYVNSDYPNVLFNGNDRLYMFLLDSSPDSKNYGVVLWRE